MHSRLHFSIPFVLLTVACERRPDPVAPDIQPRRTSVFPNLDGAFGPVVLASCERGYDLIYSQQGTVTIVESTDKNGEIERLQFIWRLTFTVANSASGFSLSGPSHGPDQTSFNTDGTVRFVQIGLIGSLRTGRGAPLTIDAGRIEFLIDEHGATIVDMSGPHPHHEDFPERPVLCALVDA